MDGLAGDGIVGAVGLLIGAVGMKLVPALSDLISSKAKKAAADIEPPKPNGNGKLTKEQVTELLSIHADKCGGRIEAKIDNLDEKIDIYRDEQRAQLESVNRRIDDHLTLHRTGG